VPCVYAERLSAVRALFEKRNAPASAMSVQTFKNVENLVVTVPGISSETIVIGAHYDFEDSGCGAIDNWTGIVALAHLYSTVRQYQPDKSILFVAFGKEENGLIGSRAMTNAIPKEQLSQYCAMINIDSFGLSTPFALDGSSSRKLTALAADLAKEMKLPFANVRIPNADSDSSSFVARDIPAVTLSGLSSNWMSILHTSSDQVKEVNPLSVYLGYRLSLAMWHRIEQAPCNAYR
jgi:Zn-dependent M28 family amino/carboxypeptidase